MRNDVMEDWRDERIVASERDPLRESFFGLPRMSSDRWSWKFLLQQLFVNPPTKWGSVGSSRYMTFRLDNGSRRILSKMLKPFLTQFLKWWWSQFFVFIDALDYLVPQKCVGRCSSWATGASIPSPNNHSFFQILFQLSIVESWALIS